MAKTGVKKITYIGHSQGTAQMFAALCDNTEFFKKHMNMFVAIAPIVKIKNLNSQMIRK